MWQGLCAVLSHSVVSDWDLSLAKTHSIWLWDLMTLRFLTFSERHSNRQEVDLFGFREERTPRVWAIAEDKCGSHEMYCG